MKLTVITVCLNAAATIAETLESVLAHRDALHEYLVIDGLSTDGTVDILKQYESCFEGRLTWASEKDSGLYDAMNKGLSLASGEFVLFLGADDILLPGIEELLEFDPPSGVELVYGDVEVAEPDGAIRSERGCSAPRHLSGVPREMPACHQGAIFSLKSYRELGGFDTRFRLAADYEFYLRFHAAGLSGHYLAVKIARYDLGGVSSKMGVATAKEYRSALLLHGVSPGVASASMLRSLVNLGIAGVLRQFPSLGHLLEHRR